MDTTAAQLSDTYPFLETKSTPELASRGARLVAKMIDTWGVLLGAAAIAGVVGVVSQDAKNLLVGVMVLAWFVYYFMKDGFNGQSLGKRVMGIQVVHGDTGAPGTLGQSIGRNLASIVGIFDVLFILGSKKRRLGDMLANTDVVKVRG